MNRLLLPLFLLTIFTSYSQTEYGLIGGISNTRLVDGFFKDFDTQNSTKGIHLGAYMDLKINDKISFYPKIIFSQQGDRKNKLEPNEDIGRFSAATQIDYKLSYINLPLNFKFFSKPYIFIGPQIGYLISTEKDTRDLGDFKKFDYGINLGLGYNWNRIGIETNFYHGKQILLTTEDAALPTPGEINFMNVVIQLSLKYILGK